MRILADLHIHSPFSRATSKRLTPRGLEAAARIKGIDLLGSGDACHPAWLERLSHELEPAEEGFFKLRTEVLGTELSQDDAPGGGLAFAQPRFVLSAELSTIYQSAGRTRRVHHLVLLPDFSAARRLQDRLGRYGKLDSDGRPILRLDSRNLLEIILETEALSLLIPAHIWTPWYSVLGEKSGFESIAKCYRDLSPWIGAVETGLSSDPPMNWALSSLDRYAIVSNSDAHSPENLGREATIFEMDPTFHGLVDALSCAGGGPGGHVAETIEFFPVGGKYYWDGHRDCEVSLPPTSADVNSRVCPVCEKPLTIGVLHRVLELADRSIEEKEALSPSPVSNRQPFRRFLPLRELLSELLGASAASRKVNMLFYKLVAIPGGELGFLAHYPAEEAERIVAGFLDPGLLTEALRRMRKGQVIAKPGSDGLYGTVRLFAPGELGARLFRH